MNNNIPEFTPQEWEMMTGYREATTKEPRENLIELISHVDPAVAELGMNSGPYFMLDRLLSDEQIEVANHLELRKPIYLEELAERAGKDIEYTAKIVDELAMIGLLRYKMDPNGVDLIELPIFVVGILEHLLLGRPDYDQYANHPEIAVGFKTHTTWTAGTNGPLLPAANHGVHRPVPVETALKDETRVESWENLMQLIDESANGSYAICDCICRKIRKQYGELGDDPEIGWCMPLGDYAEYAIRTGKGRRVTREEYLARLDEGTRRGFVHNVSNHDGPSPIEYICNCDFQSCMSIRASNFTKAANISKSNFVAKVDEETCVACGNCVEKCPANAVTLGQKVPQKKPVKYVDTDFPPEINALKWERERWDLDYLLHRQNVRPETGTSPCKTDCPAHIAVQGYLRMAAQGRYREALELIKQENPLPAVCGTVCNHRCESVCTRGDIDEAVSIDEVKKFLAYRELKEENRYIPEKNRDFGKKIAVIGAGPAGISCAYYLAVDGHDVTVFDRNKEPGGMLRYGLPSFRLEKDIVASEIEVLKTLGVEFKCGVNVGKDVTIQQLREQGYEGFFLGVGLQSGGKMRIPGEDAEGVISGIDFVREVNDTGKELKGKVVVIGGGNIGADIARTAVRCGAESVDLYCLESYDEMPMGEEDQELCQSEDITIHAGWGQTEVLSDNGKCAGIKFRKCLSVKNADGRFDPEFDDSVTETADCSTVLYCIGQKVDWQELLSGTKVEFNPNGTAKADSFTYQTAEPDIFVAGDAFTGQKFAIDAIAGGKQAAISINRYVWGNSLVSGRDRRDYKYIDKDNLNVISYDTAKRQKPPVDLSKKLTMRDERGVFTEEQIKIETARCLKCGAAHVDENQCLGCGVCTTRCKMDAITLKKKYDCVPVPNEELKPAVGRELFRRIDAKYPHNPIMRKIAKNVVKKKTKVKPRGKTPERQW